MYTLSSAWTENVGNIWNVVCSLNVHFSYSALLRYETGKYIIFPLVLNEKETVPTEKFFVGRRSR